MLVEFKPTSHSTEILHYITYQLLFYQWGMDILGPFSFTLRQVKFLLMVMDYFTKLMKVEALSKIIGEWVCNFLFKTNNLQIRDLLIYFLIQ